MVLAQKGGQGKTTVALNIAHELGYRGRDAVLMDIDPQGHLTTNIGYEFEYYNDRKHFGAYLTDAPPNPTLKDIIYPTEYNFDFIPSTDFYTKTESEVWHEPGVPTWCFKPLIEDLLEEYDYVVIDTAPSPSRFLKAALLAIDNIIIPIRPSDSQEVIEKTLGDMIHSLREEFNEPVDPPVLAIVPTFIRQRIDQQTDDRKLLESLCRDQKLRAAVPDFAYISPDTFEKIDSGIVRPPKPGIRQTTGLSETLPLREADPDNDQIECFTELAKAVELGAIPRVADKDPPPPGPDPAAAKSPTQTKISDASKGGQSQSTSPAGTGAPQQQTDGGSNPDDDDGDTD